MHICDIFKFFVWNIKQNKRYNLYIMLSNIINFFGEDMSKIMIRKAMIEDAKLILNFIKELAIYEKMEKEVKANVQEIQESLFSEGATAHALICFADDTPIGYAIYFFNYSTWLGKNGLYLEDLYISPKYRGQGAGKVVLKYLAKQAINKNCGRFEWCVLDWNEPAIKFYESIGAKAQNEWVIYRLSGETLEKFAKE
jgi:GNAT superfamily N-acetyltransferase